MGAAYAGNASTDPYRSSQINIAAGTTFSDAGAAAAAGSKQIGFNGGEVNNAGTYVRNGLGTTLASYGFNNTGTVQVDAGTFAVTSDFSNTGAVAVAGGAVLLGSNSANFANAGRLTGTGTVRTYSPAYALNNLGTIDPGSAAALGALTVDGDLALTNSSVLHIDLGGSGLSDRLTVTDSLTLDGELAVWAASGNTLHLGDVYTVATFKQRSGQAAFDSVSWHGLNGANFAVQYNATSIELRVVAVPEPASYALMLGGLAVLAWAAKRRPACAGQTTLG